MKRTILTAMLMAACAAPGCRVFRRNTARTPPPAPPPIVTPENVPPPKTAPAELPAPPEVEPAEDVTQMPAPPSERLPGPPRRPRRTRPAEAATAPPPPAEAPPQPPPPVPQLGQVLTPEQQQSYNAAIDRNLDRARSTVSVLASRRLNRQQATYLERIRAFIEQAVEVRRTDLIRAAGLSERASVLADDLLKSSQ